MCCRQSRLYAVLERFVDALTQGRGLRNFEATWFWWCTGVAQCERGSPEDGRYSVNDGK